MSELIQAHGDNKVVIRLLGYYGERTMPMERFSRDWWMMCFETYWKN